jgi:hypothetical protein
VPAPLALLLGVAALLSLAWTFTTTPLQGPDEPAHFSMTQHLAETGHLPSPATGNLPDSTTTGYAIAFFNLDQLASVTAARPAWSQLEEERFTATAKEIGEKGEKDGNGPNALGKNPPLYYAYELVPYWLGSAAGFWDRLILMRLASGLLLLLTVAFTWLAAAEVFASTWPRLIATGCVALLPELTSISGTINADNLLVCVWTAFTFLSLRLVRRGPSFWRILALCVLAAASLLTHGRGVAIVVPLAVVLAISLLRARPPLRRALAWLAPSIGFVLVTYVAYRLLLAPAGGAYGGEVNLTSGGHFGIRGFIESVWQFYLPKLPFMHVRIGPSYGYEQMFIEGFFGRFASLEVAYGDPVYRLIQAVCAVGLIGLVWIVVRRWGELRARWAEVAVLVVIAVSMIGLLHAASYRALLGGPDPLITGRYLLPLVAIAGLTAAFVLSSLRPRVSAVLGALVLSGLLALNLSGLMLTLTRFYG